MYELYYDGWIKLDVCIGKITNNVLSFKKKKIDIFSNKKVLIKDLSCFSGFHFRHEDLFIKICIRKELYGY